MDMNDTRIPAHVRAAHAKKQPREKIDNTAALKESGLTIVHANMVDYFGGERHPRAVTIAYERINKSHYRISTAVCHKADVFEKKRGTKIALANFAKGNTVIIPASSTENAANQLRRMFGFIA